MPTGEVASEIADKAHSHCPDICDSDECDSDEPSPALARASSMPVDAIEP